jgi:4-amino-4-deoxy-L-arabinose transferase-like glycosyltransferase
MRVIRNHILIIIISVVLLFLNLQIRPLFGVEGRWAEAAREMYLRKNWFVPTINFEPHLTKPLLPFWLIKISGMLLGKFNEFSIRLPAAISGLITLIAFFFLSKRLFASKQVWQPYLLLTSIGFIYFARLAQSEIFQLCWVTCALTIYIYSINNTSFWRYFLIWIFSSLGALSKGHTSFAATILPMAIDVVVNKRYFHLNYKNFIAALTAFGLYLLPIIGSCIEFGSYLPLNLLIRENIGQAINPYDNLRPFYIYLFWWPAWLAPWSIFLPLALFYFLKKYRKLQPELKFVIIAVFVIFIVFTLAKARRSYYILPILPYSILIVSYYLETNQKIISLILNIMLRIFSVLSLLSPVFVFVFLKIAKISNIMPLILYSLILAILTLFVVFRKDFKNLFKLILVISFIEVLYFCFLQPLLSTRSYVEVAEFAKSKLQVLQENGIQGRLCTYKWVSENLYFYLDQKDHIPSYDDWDMALKNCEIIILRGESLGEKTKRGEVFCKGGRGERKFYCVFVKLN